jgi:hypothetical protein
MFIGFVVISSSIKLRVARLDSPDGAPPGGLAAGFLFVLAEAMSFQGGH